MLEERRLQLAVRYHTGCGRLGGLDEGFGGLEFGRRRGGRVQQEYNREVLTTSQRRKALNPRDCCGQV